MQHLDTVWQTVLGKFFSQRFAGVSVLGIGFTLKPGERRAYLQAVRSSDQLKALGEQLKKIAAEKRLLLVVDNPEEIVGRGLQDITPENAIRIGALLSVLGRVHRMGVNVVCFLKEQIFQSVREDYPDVSHFVDQVDGLAWSAEDLLALLDTRVMRRLKSKWSQVFAISPSELRERILPFLSNGPRDLLTLCNIAGAKSELITESELLAGVKILRDDRLKDLTSQYKQWPRLALLTSALIAALREKYTTGVLPAGAVKAVFVEQFSKTRSAIYRLREIDWVDRARWESPPIDERLFVAGILGYVQNDGQKIYPWSGREIAQFRLAASHFVSPLFASA